MLASFRAEPPISAVSPAPRVVVWGHFLLAEGAILSRGFVSPPHLLYRVLALAAVIALVAVVGLGLAFTELRSIDRADEREPNLNVDASVFHDGEGG